MELDPLRPLVRFELLVMEDVRTFRIVCFSRRLVLDFGTFSFFGVCFCWSIMVEVVVVSVVAEQLDVVVVEVVRLLPKKHRGSAILDKRNKLDFV